MRPSGRPGWARARWNATTSGGAPTGICSPHSTQEAGMAIVLVHQGPTVTQENYVETVRLLTDGKEQLDSLSDWPVEGIISHVAGQGPNGFRVVDVWESEEAAQT